MIPRLKANLSWADLRYVWPSFDREADIVKFEEEFSNLAGQKHAVAFPYGRAAQFATLKALGGSGGEVICPSYTCVVVPHAIVAAGMKPVFVDSDPKTFNMDWDLVGDAVSSNTIAIISTSIFGQPTDGSGLRKFMASHPDVPIIQDCAHSFFAGNAHLVGKAAFYGLNISKIITSVFGGMVSTDDEKFASELRRIREEFFQPPGFFKELKRSIYFLAILVAFTRPIYGIVNRLERMGALDYFVKYYDPSTITLPRDVFTEMSGFEARLGLAQCGHYEKIVKHRLKIAKIYRSLLTEVGDIEMPPYHTSMTVSHFVIRTAAKERLKKVCLENGFQLGDLIDYDCSTMKCYQNGIYFGTGHSKKFPEKVVNLPVHVGVTPTDAQKIATLIIGCYT